MSTSTIPETSPLLPPPPLASGLPFIGNASAMAKDLIGFVVEQYKSLGPIFRIRALQQEFVVMASLLHMVRLEWANPKTKLQIKNDPTPTFGYTFKVRIAERRHHVTIEDHNVSH